MTRDVIEKAARLIDDGRVIALPPMGGGAAHWLVYSGGVMVERDGMRFAVDIGRDAIGKNRAHRYYVTTRVDQARCSCEKGFYAMQAGAEPLCAHSTAALWVARQP